MTREALSVAEWLLNQVREHGKARRIAELIQECERHRPTGADGKHGDRHTATCGCEDKPAAGEPTDEQVIWAEGLPNDGKYEYTLTSDCDGTVWSYLRREPRAEVKDGRWTHFREYSPWEKCSEDEYRAALRAARGL